MTIGNDSLVPMIGVQNKIDYINDQKGNRYSSKNVPPFIVHIKSTKKILIIYTLVWERNCHHFPTIINIRRVEKKFGYY